MLPPEELNKVNFTRTIRGYNPEEVEQHIGFIVEKYSEIYAQNELIKRKYNALAAQYKRLKESEDAIKAALLNAQTASSKLINETCERSELMLKNTENDCKKILCDYENKVKYQQYILSKMTSAVDDFKSELFSKYRAHIQKIEEISSEGLKDGEWNIPEDVFFEQVLADVKKADKDFEQSNEICADKEITGEKNIKNIEQTVREMIDTEKSGQGTEINADVPAVAAVRESEQIAVPSETSVVVTDTVDGYSDDRASGDDADDTTAVSDAYKPGTEVYTASFENTAPVSAEESAEEPGQERAVVPEGPTEHTVSKKTEEPDVPAESDEAAEPEGPKETEAPERTEESEERDAELDDMVAELSRLFGAENISGSSKTEPEAQSKKSRPDDPAVKGKNDISDAFSDTDELDDEIRRLLEGINGKDKK